jgi:hypothetical protein
VHATNLALAILVAGLCWLIGWRDLPFDPGPLGAAGRRRGIWLFYVQHQFEDTYWERGGQWTYPDAALRGSSYLRLPQPLQWFSGNIGLHHVHHLNARIPNYNLQRAHDENAIFESIPIVSLWSGVRAVRLKLWDEDRARLVTFRAGEEGDPRSAAARAPGPPDAVHVGVAVLGRVEVDHVRDPVDVDPARGDVGGDERATLPDSKRASARSRWLWDLLPCIATASTP